MSSSYQSFTSLRTTEPDSPSLLNQLRTLDAMMGVQHLAGPIYTLKKPTLWTANQITSAQIILDTAPAATLQLSAQAGVDHLSSLERAIIFTILDQFNVVRSKLVPPLSAITSDQMINAIRTKTGLV